MAVIADGAKELRTARETGADRSLIDRRLRAYFSSRDCAEVVAMAGLGLDEEERPDRLLAACDRASFRRKSESTDV